MRKADRLFEIIQILRRSSGPVTADAMAAELETSRRSVYRDISALLGQRVPIRGEAGIGYVLDKGFDLPPLMLTSDEIDAAVLGAHWVMSRGDPQLAKAARDLIAKIEATVPETLRLHVAQPSGGIMPMKPLPDSIDTAILRDAIRGGLRLVLQYADVEGRETTRTVWPVIIGYMDNTRILAAWCELREDFRSFRTDRILSAEPAERYPERPAVLRSRWQKKMAADRAAWEALKPPC
jgi:predicted DNA-binding transcriptional regulator YafY